MKRINIFFLLLLAGYILLAQHTVEWRYDRTGIYSKETGLMKSWPANGSELLWHFDGLGRGHTSVAIDQNQLFITGETNERGYFYVFNLDGKLQHKVEYGSEFVNSYPGSRSTVIPNDGKLYVVSGMAELFCYDMQSLKLLWKKNYAKDYGAENTKHGWHGPPLIVGDKLIIAPGGEKYNVVALNKATGDIIWSSEGAGVMSGYGVPIYLSDQQVPQIVVMMSDYITGLDISTGKLLWKYHHTNRFREHPNTPVYSNNMLFCMSSYGKGSVMLRLINGGRSVEKVWEMTELSNKTGHVIKHGNYIYGAGEKIDWDCVDWQTGKVMYSDKTLAIGNIIAADGMLYVYSEKGEMTLVKPNSQKFEIVSKFPITLGTDQHWSHPVIYQGVMYVRHGDALMAYKIKN
ncbi:MAG: PQQ-like beta-propeller repeat protein [Bacteroidetes bacterium]|nr:PQQ-like beta-propeller repeat protein [Bacteroidota bacterium]MCL2303655.1 PQQ-like beta-propeller repeat protein [Lentimicrobiaceae bacterium]